MNIYVHIPFCRSKCAYCSFLSHCDLSKEDAYTSALCTEISASKHQFMGEVDTLYLGGGTPSLMRPSNIKKIIHVLSKKYRLADGAEVTLECNPEDIDETQLESWKEAGITRLSIGVQSLNDSVRRDIGRKPAAKEALHNIELATHYFDNISVDLISGLPGETEESQLAGLGTLVGLGVKHLSMYDLEIDNDSDIARNPDRYCLPEEDEAAEMLLSSWKLLETRGYEQYEISNFSIMGYHCRHNLDFWEGKDYLGFGVGSTSRIGRIIYTNTDVFDSYLTNKFARSRTELTDYEMDRFGLISALRLSNSVDTTFGGTSIAEDKMAFAIDLGLMTDNHVITTKGKLLYNQLVKVLIPDEKEEKK